jgi:hypothetical protein
VTLASGWFKKGGIQTPLESFFSLFKAGRQNKMSSLSLFLLLFTHHENFTLAAV